jgi:hypothetical protein
MIRSRNFNCVRIIQIQIVLLLFSRCTRSYSLSHLAIPFYLSVRTTTFPTAISAVISTALLLSLQVKMPLCPVLMAMSTLHNVLSTNHLRHLSAQIFANTPKRDQSVHGCISKNDIIQSSHTKPLRVQSLVDQPI